MLEGMESHRDCPERCLLLSWSLITNVQTTVFGKPQQPIILQKKWSVAALCVITSGLLVPWVECWWLVPLLVPHLSLWVEPHTWFCSQDSQKAEGRAKMHRRVSLPWGTEDVPWRKLPFPWFFSWWWLNTVWKWCWESKQEFKLCSSLT